MHKFFYSETNNKKFLLCIDLNNCSIRRQNLFSCVQQNQGVFPMTEIRATLSFKYEPQFFLEIVFI
jgi:hypothetical protein